MPSTPVRLSHSSFVTITLFLFVAVCLPAPARAETTSAPFRIALGHQARQELCFFVGGAGPLSVVVTSDDPNEVVQVAVYAGQVLVRSAQGKGLASIAAPVTTEMLGSGREWAVVLSGVSRQSRFSGRIEVEFPGSPTTDSHPVDRWLREHPGVAFHLVWNERGRPVPYSAWPDGMQQQLWMAVDDARAGRPAALADPLPNAWMRQPGDDGAAVHTAFAPGVARDFYVASVAHALRLELDRLVPWSLLDLNGDELDALLSSGSLFWWNAAQDAYEISEFDHGWAVPAAPATAWRFLQRSAILGSSRLATVTRLVGWARELTHFAGPVSRQNFQDHWGYDGDMPVSRVLAGTRYTGTAFRSLPGYDRLRHYTAGCQGTAGLLASVLRAANIPARPRAVSNDNFTHATLLFLSEDRALSHGDDPYSQLSEGAEPEALLIDLDTYESWLGPTAKSAGRFIGRQAAAIGLERLPPVVRRAYELDHERGTEPAQSAVFALFRDTFTMVDLNEARLWERLAASGGARTTRDDVWQEAEAVDARVTSGTVDAQDMQAFTSGRWRGDAQLRWRGGRPGATLTVPFTVPAAGVYRLAVRFTRAPDSAIVSVSLEGSDMLLDRVSLFAPFVVAADPLPMGEHELQAGRHALVFTIVGSHPDATAAFTVGIDALRVERIR